MNDNTPNTPATNVPAPGTVDQVTASTSDGLFGLDFDMGQAVSTMNYFTLAWCILYSFLLMSDFFFWRVFYSNLEIPRLRRGEKAIFAATRIWWTYLPPLFVYFLYTLVYESGIANTIGLFALAGYFIKMIFDLPHIPVLNTIPNAVIKGFQSTAKAVTPELPKKEEKK